MPTDMPCRMYDAVDRPIVGGANVIETRWVETTKSSEAARCRFIAEDIVRHRRDDVHAVPPSNLAKRLIEFFAAKMYYPTIAADASVEFSHTHTSRRAKFGSALRRKRAGAAAPARRCRRATGSLAWVGSHRTLQPSARSGRRPERHAPRPTRT